jgi:hypothetical protein
MFELFPKIFREDGSFIKNLTTETGNLYEFVFAFTILSCKIIFKLEVFQMQILEKTKYILCATTSSRNRAVCGIMWKNMVEPEWPQMRHITKATHTHCLSFSLS